jgi:hypothetical protein
MTSPQPTLLDVPVASTVTFTPCFIPATTADPTTPAVIVTLTYPGRTHPVRFVTALPDGIEETLGLAIAEARWLADHVTASP